MGSSVWNYKTSIDQNVFLYCIVLRSSSLGQNPTYMKKRNMSYLRAKHVRTTLFLSLLNFYLRYLSRVAFIKTLNCRFFQLVIHCILPAGKKTLVSLRVLL